MRTTTVDRMSEWMTPRPSLVRTARQFARYVVVGGIAFVADAGCLFLLHEHAGLSVYGSAAIAFCIGTAVNYALSIRWVFSSRRVGDRRVEFAIFAAVGIAGLGL